MRDSIGALPPVARLLGVGVLAAMSAWLVVQNTLLLVAALSARTEAPRVVLGALVKVAALLLAELWIVPVAIALVGIVVVALLHSAEPRMEVSRA